MSEPSNEKDVPGLISDEELPEDLRPDDREPEDVDKPDDPLPEG